MKYIAITGLLLSTTIMAQSDEDWLDSITLPPLDVKPVTKHKPVKAKRKHSSNWLDFIDLGETTINIRPKLNPSEISVVTGAITQHTNTDEIKDGLNPLLGVESGTVQCGAYDNSRIRTSRSYYCTSKWYKRQVGIIDSEFNSKVGLAYYDDDSGYKSYVTPMATMGLRKRFKGGWVDLDYAPGEMMSHSGVLALTVGFDLW